MSRILPGGINFIHSTTIQPIQSYHAVMSERQIGRTTDHTNHSYDILPSSQHARYLLLHPANSDSDRLTCTLYTARLDDFPSFEAISYVWGTPVQNRLIRCNGKNIPITANLYDALLQVRLENKPRTLWVDSICINQADPNEQGEQVFLMDQIYTKSSCTLICLGKVDNDHARIVADIVELANHTIQKVFDRASFDWEPNSFPFPDEGSPLLSHSGWQSLGVLLKQPWFKRGWVVQEAALSRSALILWAETEIDWANLMRVYIWRYWRALILPDTELHLSDLHLHGFYIRHRREVIPFRPEGAAEPLPFLEILDLARGLGVTDPRDRIYAFNKVASPSKFLPALRPNYNTPYLRVYHDFACEYLRLSTDLDILHYAHNDGEALKADFPSWVPRWNLHLYPDHTVRFNSHTRSSEPYASLRSTPTFILSTDQCVLELGALIIDTVNFVARKFDKMRTTPDDVASLWNTVSRRPNRLPYSCSPSRAFVEIFRCGVYRGRLMEWQRLESAYMLLLQHELHEDSELYSLAESFHQKRMEDMHNKSFIMSSRGYYGLAPQTVEEGDVYCIISGTRTPFILRRTDRPGHYKLVGSVLILSKEPDRNGYPSVLGQGRHDWIDWGLEEELIFLC